MHKREWNKLFGIGMPKTATGSLAKACAQLGLSVIHFPKIHQIKNVDMANDLPVTAHYQELDKLFPNSKFILTVRDQQSWEASFINHLDILRVRNDGREIAATNPTFIHRKKLYGTHILTMPIVIETRKRHEQEVLDYFKYRMNDLLIMNIPAGDGWEKLCPFIHFPIPDDPFPHAHKTNDVKKRLGMLT